MVTVMLQPLLSILQPPKATPSSMILPEKEVFSHLPIGDQKPCLWKVKCYRQGQVTGYLASEVVSWVWLSGRSKKKAEAKLLKISFMTGGDLGGPLGLLCHLFSLLRLVIYELDIWYLVWALKSRGHLCLQRMLRGWVAGIQREGSLS